MKHFTKLAVVGALAALAPASASALSFSVLNPSSNLSGNTAGDFASQYGAILPSGYTWTVAPNTVTPPLGSTDGAFLSPWANAAGTSTDLEEVNSYFNVQPGDAGGTSASPDPAKLNLGSVKRAFTFLWGSIDVENTIEFYKGGTSVGAVTGSMVVGASPGGNDVTLSGCGPLDSNSYGCVAEVSFTDADGFDEIFFSAGSPDDPRNSFEFAMVPLPAAAWLLLGVSGGLIAAKRRKSKKNA